MVPPGFDPRTSCIRDAKPACVAARTAIWWPFEGALGDVIGLCAFYRLHATNLYIALGCVRVNILGEGKEGTKCKTE